MRFCSLASGSSGNCHYIETAEYRILVDVGLSGRQIEQAMRQKGLDPAGVDAVFVTHEHNDHIRGVGIWARRYRVPVLATAGTWRGMEGAVGEIPGKLQRELVFGKGYRLGKLRIEAVPLCHDANQPCGYSFEEEGRRIVIVTDTGILTEQAMNKLREADLAVVESNHDLQMLMKGPYPPALKKRIRSNLGHLSNDDCGAIVAELSAYHRNAIYLLGHLSHENNLPELALRTVRQILKEKTGSSGDQIYLTHREEPTDIFVI